MRKEDIVVSLELAKKLKETGVNSPSLFYWRVWNDKSLDIAMEHEDDFDYSGAGRKVVEKIPAYTATELMEMLPSSIRVREGKYTLRVYKFRDGYGVEYGRWHDNKIEIIETLFENEKLADALAQALIWWRKRKWLNKQNWTGNLVKGNHT